MDEYVKFNNQTAGRDKIFRFLQYCSRITWYTLERKGTNAIYVEKAKKIDESLGLMRRLLRFGRFFETLHSALPVMSTINDQVVRLTSTLSRISSSCFMLIDHIVCLHKLGLLPQKLINPSRWDKASSKFWLYSILLGLIRDVYEIMRIYKEEYQMSTRQHLRNKRDKISTYKDFTNTKTSSSSLDLSMSVCISSAKVAVLCVKNHSDVAIDSLKNFCDMFIPLNVLGFVTLSPAVVSLLGIISTIASAVPQINPMVKMVPAT